MSSFPKSWGKGEGEQALRGRRLSPARGPFLQPGLGKPRPATCRTRRKPGALAAPRRELWRAGDTLAPAEPPAGTCAQALGGWGREGWHWSRPAQSSGPLALGGSVATRDAACVQPQRQASKAGWPHLPSPRHPLPAMALQKTTQSIICRNYKCLVTRKEGALGVAKPGTMSGVQREPELAKGHAGPQGAPSLRD